jgi:hypothetical protein
MLMLILFKRKKITFTYEISVAEPHNFYAAPAPTKWWDALRLRLCNIVWNTCSNSTVRQKQFYNISPQHVEVQYSFPVYSTVYLSRLWLLIWPSIFSYEWYTGSNLTKQNVNALLQAATSFWWRHRRNYRCGSTQAPKAPTAPFNETNWNR